MSASLNVSDQDADAHQQMHFLSFVTFQQVRVEMRHQWDIIILTCYTPNQVQNMFVTLRMFYWFYVELSCYSERNCLYWSSDKFRH